MKRARSYLYPAFAERYLADFTLTYWQRDDFADDAELALAHALTSLKLMACLIKLAARAY